MALNWNMAFGGGGLDRMSARRGEAAALLGAASARVLPMWRGRPLVSGSAEAPALVSVPPEHPICDLAAEARVLLGRAAGYTLFAADLSTWSPPGAPPADAGPGRRADDQPAPDLPLLPDDARFADLRGHMDRLTALDAEVAASARAILDWHRSHGFCAACGTPTQSEQAGWQRRCPACGRHHFPRTDPVVIMLVTHGNRTLLGRSPSWPEGMYSCLAGFMEPGETVEAAVRREVDEEAGVALGAVRLVANQPWPFPSSLMLGCRAEALGTDITLDPAELDDALWLSREDALAALAGLHPVVRPPRRGAIAATLIQMWVAGELD